MENENMYIWDKVSATDPKYTRFGQVNGMAQTSITPMYVFKRATEVFGSVGKGWGYDIKEERFDDGAMKFNGEGVEIGKEVMHTCLVSVWYVIDGERHEVEYFGHTPYIMSTKYGLRTDFEAPKKSLTDAIKKALSMLGFTADVFMGEFDDQAYVEQRSAESEIERSEDKDAKTLEIKQKYIDEMGKLKKQMAEAVNMSMLQGLFVTSTRKAKYRGDESMIIEITKIKDKRKGELENEK